MNTSGTNDAPNINTADLKRLVLFHRKPGVFLTLGILCYIVALVLFTFRNEITTSAFLKQLRFSLATIADYLWSTPSVVITIPVFLAIVWLYYYVRREEKSGRYLKWLTPFPSFIRLSLLFFFFIFTLLP